MPRELIAQLATSLFAAKPPSESAERLMRRLAHDPMLSIMHSDATSAYFYAEGRDIHVKLPDEGQRGHELSGKLAKAVYATRGWVRCKMKSQGFAVDVLSSGVFPMGVSACLGQALGRR